MAIIGLVMLLVAFTGQSILASTSVELWYLHHSYLVSDDAVDKSKKLIDQAVAAGYTGLILWDSSLSRMASPGWNPDNQDRIKEVLSYAHKRHLKTLAEVAPFGWSNDALLTNPNWAEAQRIIGARFQVSPDGRTLKLQNSAAPLINGDFHSPDAAWFSMGDSGIKVDPTGYQGRPAVTIVNPTGNARLRQDLAVQPWHQYHLSLAYRATGKQLGTPMVNVYDAASFDKVRSVSYLHASESWSQLDYAFNSGDSRTIGIYMGVWGGAQGTVQFANVQLEETAFVWLAHRDGAPFKVYDSANPEKVYTAGVDYNEVSDPDMRPGGNFNRSFHTPQPFTLPATTSLKPGDMVAVDFYAVTPYAAENQVGMCMTDAGVFHWLAKNAQQVHKILPAESSILLAYDEIRHANSCASCRARNMTPGELLAWNFAETFGIYHQALPDSSFWVWNDMFDPFHNAHDHIDFVEGSFAGSWKGLPPEVGILNWNLPKLKESLTFFSGLNPDQPVAHPQMIAGFYDAPDAAAAARSEASAAAGIPGVRGLMYTTWVDDYSKLKVFADAARDAWPDYLKSVPTK